ARSTRTISIRLMSRTSRPRADGPGPEGSGVGRMDTTLTGSRTRSRRRPAGVLILGSGDRARRIADLVERDTRQPARVYGFVDDDPSDEDRAVLGSRYLGRMDRLAHFLTQEGVTWVIFGLPRRFLALESTANAIGLCETLGIDVSIPLDLFDTR